MHLTPETGGAFIFGMLFMLLVMTLAGCASVPPGDFCDIADPIRLFDPVIDAMSDQEVAAALAHNLKGQMFCDWRPS